MKRNKILTAIRVNEEEETHITARWNREGKGLPLSSWARKELMGQPEPEESFAKKLVKSGILFDPKHPLIKEFIGEE